MRSIPFPDPAGNPSSAQYTLTLRHQILGHRPTLAGALAEARRRTNEDWADIAIWKGDEVVVVVKPGGELVHTSAAVVALVTGDDEPTYHPDHDEPTIDFDALERLDALDRADGLEVQDVILGICDADYP